MSSKTTVTNKDGTPIGPVKHCIAGGLAGGIEVAIMYPTEYVKTQLQLERRREDGKPPRFKNSIDCAKKIVKDKGPLALYRGLSSLLAGTVPKTSVRFTAYGQLKKLVKDKDGNLTPTRTLIAGMGTGAIESLAVVIPVETMKTKLIHDQNSDNPRFRGLFHGIKEVFKEEGITGVYRGVAPTLGKQMGNQGIRFMVFEEIKKLLQGSSKDGPVPFWKSFVGGGTAGIVSVLGTMPFDVVKTRMQGLEAKYYKHSLDCVIQMLKHEGILSFWKGTAARLPRVAFGQSITLSGYDVIVKMLAPLW
eukprot:gb/GECG01006486.1/.p1 GENE.gb/GECG01006486.1/~~gb/GECG01006486.1/.p1  ORF type:complete len:304 (+),score=36.65 gb/GECG01006486.1/:1-912(+)